MSLSTIRLGNLKALSYMSWLCYILPTAADATVLEYDQSNNFVVSWGSIETFERWSNDDRIRQQKSSQTKASLSIPAKLTDEQKHYRAMARDIAMEFGGAEGVRNTGLSTLEFIELFDVLIYRESSFDPNKASPKGAEGLGQLLPNTAADMGVKDSFDPEQNLKGAAKYLVLLLGYFKRVDMALAAYNAGPDRVAKLGRIPRIKETQEYIAWIMDKAGIKNPSTSSLVFDSDVKPKPSSTSQFNQEPAQAGKPLTGEVTVWEF